MKIENNVYMPRTAATEGKQEIKKNSNLSIDDLMKIIAAELSNQSLVGSEGGGGSKTDYVGQLSQLTMMEQMSEIGEGLTNLNFMGQHQYAFGLIGKEVMLINPENPDDKEQNIIGVVDKVKFQAGYAVLEVGGKDYPMGAVLEVGNEGTITKPIKPEEKPEEPEVDGEDKEQELIDKMNNKTIGNRFNMNQRIEPLKDIENLPLEGDVNE